MTHTQQPPQSHLYYQAVRKAGETNELFLSLVQAGMTREELAANIARRPHLWGRFAGYLATLPTTSKE